LTGFLDLTPRQQMFGGRASGKVTVGGSWARFTSKGTEKDAKNLGEPKKKKKKKKPARGGIENHPETKSRAGPEPPLGGDPKRRTHTEKFTVRTPLSLETLGGRQAGNRGDFGSSASE